MVNNGPTILMCSLDFWLDLSCESRDRFGSKSLRWCENSGDLFFLLEIKLTTISWIIAGHAFIPLQISIENIFSKGLKKLIPSV